MKKKINKIPRSNAIIRYLTNNKNVNATIRYSSDENDKKLFKDVSPLLFSYKIKCKATYY